MAYCDPRNNLLVFKEALTVTQGCSQDNMQLFCQPKAYILGGLVKIHIKGLTNLSNALLLRHIENTATNIQGRPQ
jgi:hypothetical protein